MPRLQIVIFILKNLKLQPGFSGSRHEMKFSILLGINTCGRKREEAVLVRGRRKAMTQAQQSPSTLTVSYRVSIAQESVPELC